MIRTESIQQGPVAYPVFSTGPRNTTRPPKPSGVSLLEWRKLVLEILIADRGPCLRLLDKRSGTVTREWNGLVAGHILTFGVLPARYCQPGIHPCDKTMMWHLILAATAAECAVERLRNDTDDQLWPDSPSSSSPL